MSEGGQEIFTGVFSVTQINEYVRMVLDSQPALHHVWLRGEISNFTNHYKSGHFYFSLKDENCSLRAVMFRGSNQYLNFVPANGMKVLACGEIRSYPRDGQTQIVVEELHPDGIGSLALAFEQLRRKLEQEGIFDVSRKKSLPKFPRRIGVVTSPTGAAIHDIIRIAGERFPLAEIILYPALVQGADAPRSLRTGIEFFNATKLVDVMILGRGGGSREDLWAFNDEALARTVAMSKIPIVSAVGHESDTCLCDFAADLRAPTPSGAAEIVTPDASEWMEVLRRDGRRMEALVAQRLSQLRQLLLMRSRNKLLVSPEVALEERRMRLRLREQHLDHLVEKRLERYRASISMRSARMEALSPLNILSRGYTMVREKGKGICTSAQDLSVGMAIELQFADGSATAVVDHVQRGFVRLDKKQ